MTKRFELTCLLNRLPCATLVNVTVCFVGVVLSEGQSDCEGLQLSPARQYHKYES